MIATFTRPKLLFTSISLVFLSLSAFSQTVTIYLRSPVAYQISGDSLLVKAEIISTFELDTVYAAVSSHSGALKYDQAPNSFTGYVVLTGLPQDTLTLTVTAKDLLGNTSSANLQFIYKLPPVLVIESPLDFSVARPEIHIRASCTDYSGSCRLILPFGIVAQNSIDTILDLSTFEGTEFGLAISAGDQYDQYTAREIPLYVESSAYLEEFYVVPDKIWDFNYNTILAGKTVINDPVNQINHISNLTLTNVIHNSVDTIPYKGYVLYNVNTGTDLQLFENRVSLSLTPYGALFGATDSIMWSNRNNQKVYDYNQGVLEEVSTAVLNSASANLKTAGDYAIWTQGLGAKLRFRNLALKQTIPIGILSPVTYGNFNLDVAENGVAAFWVIDGSNSNVVKWQNNNYSFVSDSADFTKRAIYPLTDGSRVVYRKVTGGNFTLHLHDNNGTTQLSNLATKEPVPMYQYQVNPKFVAYAKAGTSGQFQLWLRDTAGVDKQISFFGNDSKLEKLGKEGDMIFYTDYTASAFNSKRRRFWADSSATFKEISSGNFGKVFQHDNDWYFAIGRVLYKVNLDAAPGVVMNSNLGTDLNATFKFSANNFAAQFDGDGSLLTVKITDVPANGRLLLDGAAVTAGTVIQRSNLSRLTYVPNNGFTGTDTIKWTASNGINFATTDALMVMHVTTALQEPVITGLAADYCTAQSAQKGKVSNLPAASSGVAVSVTLDDNALPVAADSTFTFDVNNLPEGAHTIQVKYDNFSTHKVITHDFTVTKAVNPDVNLSSNITNITSLALPVILTATNAAGGGSGPLYTFARDRNFTNVAQAESVNNAWTFDPSILAVGDNMIYVRMKSNAGCVTANTVTDSILLKRSSVTGINDPDLPGQVINIYPNPFRDVIMIKGLSSSKTYTVTLYSLEGKQILSRRVSNRTTLNITRQHQATGTYWLSVYDEKKKQLLGTVKLLKQ